MTEHSVSSVQNGRDAALATQITVVRDINAETFIDRSRLIEDRIAKLETSLLPLADRRREVDRFFRSVQQDAARIDPAKIEDSFDELRSSIEAIRLEVAALKQDVTEAVTYIGRVSNIRFSRVEAVSNHLNHRTTKLEEHASFVTDTLRRYLNVWPLSMIRGIRRKVRRLPDTPLGG